MRTLLVLLCTFPLFCIAQSPSNSTAALQHQEALQQLQQHQPKAQSIDLESLAAQQEQAPIACENCALKAAKNKENYKNGSVTLSKSDLLAKQTHLLALIQDLRQATPVDVDLLKKYRRALELNVAAIKTVEAEELRQAKKAMKQ